MAAGVLAMAKTGVVCPVGLSAPQAAASIRAGVSRVAESSLMGHDFNPIVAGFLAEDVLPPLDEGLVATPDLTSLQRRLLRLASPALQEACQGLPDLGPIPLLLAGPRPTPGHPPILREDFLELLSKQAKLALHPTASKLYALGRAGVFLAIQEAATAYLFPGRAPCVLVGGVDSYLDPVRLDILQQQGRLKTAGLSDGFSPGEGAAFLLLSTSDWCQKQGLAPLASIAGVGLGMEPGHQQSDQPYRGDGLAEAVTQLFEAVGDPKLKVETVLAGYTGESFHTKEWGVAFLRNRKHFAPDPKLEHPAEYTGDLGAALAPLMMATSAVGLGKGYLAPPALVWASSDEAERGASLLLRAEKA